MGWKALRSPNRLSALDDKVILWKEVVIVLRIAFRRVIVVSGCPARPV